MNLTDTQRRVLLEIGVLDAPLPPKVHEGEVCREAEYERHAERVRQALALPVPIKPPETYKEAAERLADCQTFDQLMPRVAELYGVTVREILVQRRTKRVSEARSVAAAVLRDWGYSFPAIGKMMGERNHSTIISCCRRARLSA